jgi:hypothetical protein
LLRDIERLLKRPLQISVVPEFPISVAPTPVASRESSGEHRRPDPAARPSRTQGQRRGGGGAGRGRGAPAHNGKAAGGDGGVRRQRMH